jgi:ABC-type nitrate/sulfonate/bicarbonate transport system permease component
MTTINHSAETTARRAAGATSALLSRVLLRLCIPALLLLVWSAASVSAPGIASVLPPPHQVLASLWHETITGPLLLDAAVSLLRALGGFLVSGGIGVGVGLLMSQSRVIRHLLSGPVELLRPISSIAWIPLAILWFGLGYQSVVFVIAISCVFIVLINTLAAASQIDPDLVKAALTLGTNRWTLFRKVVVPNALPGILLGLRIALSAAWGGVLVAEMIATQQGLGYMVLRAQAAFRPDLVIGGLLVVGLVGYLLNVIFVRIQRRLLHV